MELQFHTIASPERYIASPDHQYQKYCSINLSKSASSSRSKERLYKVASILAMVAGAILLVGIVAGVAIALLAIPGVGPVVAALVASLVLVGGTCAYRRVFYEGFENMGLGMSFGVVPWKRKAEMHGENAELNESIAKMAKIARDENPRRSQGQSNIIGRVRHWESLAASSSVRIDDLQGEIQATNTEIRRIQASCTPEELKLLKIKLDADLRELNRIIATEHIAAKVKAAYFRHIIDNPSETHGFEEFGTLATDSYLESLEGHTLGRSSNIFYSNLDQPKKNWTVNELLHKNSKEIAREIFSKTIKVA